MGKLREDVRIGLLGAAAALFSSSVTLLIARIDAYYGYLSWQRETDYRFRYEQGVENLWWLPVSVWHILLSVVASLLVHRYLTTRLRSPFLIWQVVGTSSLLGWGLTLSLLVGLECITLGSLSPLEYMANSVNAVSIAKYVSTVFACNVVYGSMMSACSQQYAGQFGSQDALPSSENKELSF